MQRLARRLSTGTVAGSVLWPGLCGGLVLGAYAPCQSAAVTSKSAAIPKSGKSQTTPPPVRFSVQQVHPQPVIDRNHLDAKDNKYGFEGGSVVKVGGTYHLFTAEMVGDPVWVKMRLAHWTSPDALHWKRQATLKETSGQPRAQTGLPYASVWAPMPIWNRQEQRWNLFYVTYDTGGAAGGRIWRAVSTVAGKNGIGGPYKDIGIILQPDAQSQPWEGDQGTDSFYPYPVGDHWLAFYGSHANKPEWLVGLAEAPSLAGPWTRLATGNPLAIDPIMVENPIVTQVKGGYLMVYDADVVSADGKRDASRVGFSSSPDGVHWTKGGRITVQPDGPEHWSKLMRTPLGLVPEGGNRFTLLYTAERLPGGFYCVGMVRVKQEKAKLPAAVSGAVANSDRDANPAAP